MKLSRASLLYVPYSTHSDCVCEADVHALACVCISAFCNVVDLWCMYVMYFMYYGADSYLGRSSVYTGGRVLCCTT